MGTSKVDEEEARRLEVDFGCSHIARGREPFIDRRMKRGRNMDEDADDVCSLLAPDGHSIFNAPTPWLDVTDRLVV